MNNEKVLLNVINDISKYVDLRHMPEFLMTNTRFYREHPLITEEISEDTIYSYHPTQITVFTGTKAYPKMFNLRHFNFNPINPINTSNIIIPTFNKLKILAISTDNCTTPINIGNQPNLKTLIIYNNVQYGIPMPNYADITIGECDALEIIDISFVGNLIFDNNLPKLRYLSFSNCHIISNMNDMKFKSLKHMVFSNTDVDVNIIVPKSVTEMNVNHTNCKNNIVIHHMLNSLDIDNSFNFTMPLVTELICNNINLDNILVNDSLNVTEKLTLNTITTSSFPFCPILTSLKINEINVSIPNRNVPNLLNLEITSHIALDLSQLIKLNNLQIDTYGDDLILPVEMLNLISLSITSIERLHVRLPRMPNIQTLELYGILVEYLQRCPMLHTLDIDHTDMITTDIEPSLTKLFLSNQSFRLSNVRVLYPNLKSITLYNAYLDIDLDELESIGIKIINNDDFDDGFDIDI